MLLGTASAKLVGLLFVVASLNLKHLQDVRQLARRMFRHFITTLIIVLVFLWRWPVLLGLWQYTPPASPSEREHESRTRG
jgi:hypothetical protein